MAFLSIIILIIDCGQQELLAEACGPWRGSSALSVIFVQSYKVDFRY